MVISFSKINCVKQFGSHLIPLEAWINATKKLLCAYCGRNEIEILDYHEKLGEIVKDSFTHSGPSPGNYYYAHKV